MKMRHMFLPLIFAVAATSSCFAAENEDAATLSAKDGNGDTTVFALPAANSNDSEEPFKEMVREIHRQEQQPSHKVTLKKFTSESAAFFVAIAAVQFEALLVNFSDNPRALQDHIESVKDPIGHLSFYMFMYANGISTSYLASKIGADVDPLSRAQKMRSISYKGMAIGSMASSVTGEVLGALKECSKRVFAKGQEQKVETQKVCDAAFAQWKRGTKAQQYVSQIMSLFISTDAAQLIEKGGKVILRKAIETAPMKVVAAKARQVFEVAGIELLVALVPGGWIPKGVRIVGKVTQFAGFTLIDHYIAPPIHKAVATLWQPLNFDLDAQSFNETVFKAKRNGWTNSNANLRLSDDIEEITKSMSEWRQAQLAKYYTSSSIWSEMLSNVLSQTNGTYVFYKSYIENMFVTLNVDYAIHNQNLSPKAIETKSQFPFRLLPLYGVKPTGLPPDYISENNLYLLKPWDLETYQLRTIRASASAMATYLANKKLGENDSVLMKEIMAGLNSNDKTEMGKALVKINKATIYDKIFVVDNELKSKLMQMRSELGNPFPILNPGQGFSYAFERNDFNSAAMKELSRNRGPGSWLPLTTDYLTMQMVCGGESVPYQWRFGFQPIFIAPKLIQQGLKVSKLCSSLDLTNIYGMSISTSNGQVYKGVTELIAQNIRSDIFGDIKDEKSKSTFFNWWQTNVNSKLLSMYRTFDSEYINVLKELSKNWKGYEEIEKCLNDGKQKTCKQPGIEFLNGSDYLNKNVLFNLRFEMDIYTAILNELVVDTAREYKEKSIQRQNIQTRLLDYGKNPVNSVVRQQNIENLQLDEAKKRKTDLLYAEKDFGGFLRRLKSGDSSIISGQKVLTLEKIAEFKKAVHERLHILGRIDVKDGVILNFPEKEASKQAISELEEAVNTLNEEIKPLFEAETAAKSVISNSRKAILEKTVAGIQSVLGEISGLNMAMYASKYKLEDSYTDLMSDMKGAKDSKAEHLKTTGTNVFGK